MSRSTDHRRAMERTKTLRYLAILTWMLLAATIMLATLLHVASGNPLDLSTAFDWVASIAQVGAFLIVAVQWHEQLAMIDQLSRRMEALDERAAQPAATPPQPPTPPVPPTEG